MQVVSLTGKAKAQANALAERYGWPLDGAEGYVDGEAYRRRGNVPMPPYVLVGIDEYAQGFRAGYFGRRPSFATLASRHQAN